MSRPRLRKVVLTGLGTLVLALSASPAVLAKDHLETVRFATFNASLNRYSSGQLVQVLAAGESQQVKNVAEIIQRVRPDVLLLNEFDYDSGGEALRLFQQNFLSKSQNGAAPIVYPHRFSAPSNTGTPSGKDLDNNGAVVSTPGPGYGNDSFGFGEFPGQFGMAVYSRHPIGSGVRTFQTFKWKDMPGNLIPQPFYSPDEVDVLRLSSKSHWDLPIRIDGERTHFLVSHPTPPVFDGPEDRNGRRNHDEIRFWADYVTPGRNGYIYDDAGRRGGLNPSEHFVIAGDQNADPIDGDSIPGAIQQLLNNKRINTRVTPASPGGPQQSAKQGQVNAKHRGNPAFDTADFDDRLADPNATPPRRADAAGNLRVDYVLPDRRTDIERSFVFWPLDSDPLFRLVGTFDFRLLPDGNGFPSSDHRLVAVDVEGDD